MIEQRNNYTIYDFNSAGENFGQERDRVSSDYLITIPYGIGDAVYVGLSAVGQMAKSSPQSFGKIDILCNALQAEIFMYDPRINNIIVADKTLFPTQDKRTWTKAFLVDSRGRELLEFLQEKQYKAVFPGNAAFGFLHRLQAKVLYPNPVRILKDYSELRNFRDAPASRRIRDIIHKALKGNASIDNTEEEMILYISSKIMAEGQRTVATIKSELSPDAESALLVVAPDTSSGVTRPPTNLLTEGIGEALSIDENLIVCILPSYSDPNASIRLKNQLASRFEKRVFLIPAEPKPSLLLTTALIDEADLLVTGDTGTMHLAAATKKLIDIPTKNTVIPKNSVRIIALFGGTNPGLCGYSERAAVLGRGRRDQAKIRPGLLKEGYDPKDKDFFTHISPQELTQAILRHSLSSRSVSSFIFSFPFVL